MKKEKVSQIGWFEDKDMARKTKKEGEEKTIFFSKVSCPYYEQYGMENSQEYSFLNVLRTSFESAKLESDKDYISFEFENNVYNIYLHEYNDKYYFGKLSGEKTMKDALTIYEADQKEYNSILMKYFTFFYFDIEKQALVWIGHKSLKNLNKLFVEFFKKHSNIITRIEYFSNKEFLNKLKRSTKIHSVEFKLTDNCNITKSIDNVLAWDRDLSSYLISVKIKRPSRRMVQQIVEDPEKTLKVNNPIIAFDDEDYKKNIVHLFENYFTLKDYISLNDFNGNDLSKIKNKLANALTRNWTNV